MCWLAKWHALLEHCGIVEVAQVVHGARKYIMDWVETVEEGWWCGLERVRSQTRAAFDACSKHEVLEIVKQ